MDVTNAPQQQTLPSETPEAQDRANLTLREATMVRGGSLVAKTGVRGGKMVVVKTEGV
jgi:hypothetical protein